MNELHPELERVEQELNRDNTEQYTIEELCEQFLQEPLVQQHVEVVLGTYNLDFDHHEALTGDQEELVCQYQNMIYMQILSGMMRRLSGRGFKS